MYLPKKVGEVARCRIWEELDGSIRTRPSVGDKYTTSTMGDKYTAYTIHRHARTPWEEVYSAYYIHTMGGSGDKKDWDNLG